MWGLYSFAVLRKFQTLCLLYQTAWMGASGADVDAIDLRVKIEEHRHIGGPQRNAALCPVRIHQAFVQVNFAAQRRTPWRSAPFAVGGDNSVSRFGGNSAPRTGKLRIPLAGVADAQTFTVLPLRLDQADGVHAFRRAAVALPRFSALRYAAKRHRRAQQYLPGLKQRQQPVCFFHNHPHSAPAFFPRKFEHTATFCKPCAKPLRAGCACVIIK